VIVFGGVAWMIRGTEGGGSLGALMFCGALLTWLSFSEALLHAAQALGRNAGFIRSMDVPGYVFVAESMVTSLLGSLVTLSLLVTGVVIALNAVPRGALLAVVALLLFHLFALGLALALAPMNVLLPDVAEILRSGLHLWLWTMPIVYSESRIPEVWRFVLDFNPPWVFVRSIRDLVTDSGSVPGLAWATMAGTALGSLWVGSSLGKRLEPSVRDVL
jgi:ABC-type polysaccharide/polyol phosphate export permease